MVTYFPFQDEPDIAQVGLLQQIPDQYDVLALANVSNLGPLNSIPNKPPEATLKRMFSPLVTSLDPAVGGLGIYKPDFMRRANQDAGDYHAVDAACGRPPWSG